MILYNNVFAGGKTKDDIIKVTVDQLKELGVAKHPNKSVIYQSAEDTVITL